MFAWRRCEGLLGKLTVLSPAAQVKRIAAFATDCHCEFDAFIANTDLRTSNECGDVPFMLSTKGASRVKFRINLGHPALRLNERWQQL